MERVKGFEPSTFSLGSGATQPIPHGNPRIGPRLSSGLSSEPARDPVALAQELLAQAERSSTPAPLIAAARALLAESAVDRRSDGSGTAGARAS